MLFEGEINITLHVNILSWLRRITISAVLGGQCASGHELPIGEASIISQC